MSLQARAEATRQKIIDAAVDLFEDVGYGDTSLGDVIARAGITKGAYYYHFTGKEAVAAAIIDQAETQKRDAILRLTSSATSALESIIQLSFIVADTIQQDKVARVANLLVQALGQISPAGALTYTQFQSLYVSVVEQAIVEGDLLDDLDAEDVMQTILGAVLGTQLLSGATGDDLLARLAQVWKVLLRGIVPRQKLSYFQQFVTRRAQQHPQPENDGRASASRLPSSPNVDSHDPAMARSTG
jgi:AcrR family transcriptional regulator